MHSTANNYDVVLVQLDGPKVLNIFLFPKCKDLFASII